jgi:Ca2+:H+ antiporter
VKYLYLLLIFAPIAIIGSFLHLPETFLFIASALAVIPAAGILGRGTEELAVHTGPRLGGLVKASITGSILGNVLLVMGASVLLGGLKNGPQRFDRTHAGMNATQLLLAVLAMMIPSLFFFAHVENVGPVESLSLGVAAAMISIYALGLLFSFRSTSPEPALAEEVEAEHAGSWSIKKAILVLVAATVLIAWLSEILVGAVEYTSQALGLSEFFIGIIVVPLVGNVAEHVVAVQAALKNKMELSMAVSTGSSLQIALFVAPLLVFISLLMGNPLTLVFNPFEVVALFSGVLIAVFVSQDGETNWLEGALLDSGTRIFLCAGLRLIDPSTAYNTSYPEARCHRRTSIPFPRSLPTSSPSLRWMSCSATCGCRAKYPGSPRPAPGTATSP